VEEDKWLPGWELVDTEALDDWLSVSDGEIFKVGESVTAGPLTSGYRQLTLSLLFIFHVGIILSFRSLTLELPTSSNPNAICLFWCVSLA